MHLLYFWKREHYSRNMRDGHWFHLNQRAPRMRQIAPGESLWAFTRDHQGRYVLAAELVVRRTALNNPAWTDTYGAFRVCGDLRRSAYFNTYGVEPVEALLRGLSVAPSSKVLGQSFQGPGAVRRLTQQDHERLVAFAATLPLDPRVHPEGRRDVADQQIQRELSAELMLVPPASALSDGPARRQVTTSRYARDPRLVLALHERYAGRCQLCTWAPRERYGLDVCEGHHIQWLSRDGVDDVGNLVLLCPNHHRAVHADEAVFDFADLSFHFSEHVEGLQLNSHLVRAE